MNTPPLGVKKGVGFFPPKRIFWIRGEGEEEDEEEEEDDDDKGYWFFSSLFFVVVIVDCSTMSGVPRCSTVDRTADLGRGLWTLTVDGRGTVGAGTTKGRGFFQRRRRVVVFFKFVFLLW